MGDMSQVTVSTTQRSISETRMVPLPRFADEGEPNELDACVRSPRPWGESPPLARSAK